MSSTSLLISTIEELAYELWPPEHEEILGDWKLRASQGFTKRANSVFTLNQIPNEANWLSRIESFYQKHQLPVHYHVSDASPQELRKLLANQGYYEHTGCYIMTAPTAEVLWKSKQLSGLSYAMEVESTLAANADEDWIEDFIKIEEHDPIRQEFYSYMFQRIQGPQCYIKMQKNLQTIGIGTAIMKEDWTGLLNIGIDVSMRGRGLSYLLLYKLAEWSAEHKSTHMFLQVVADNKPAVALYKNIGFKPLYQYHYWSKA
jgi:N-acetylglutamate synthase